MNFHVSILIFYLCSLNLASSENAANCSSLTSCDTCVSSKNPCYWCVEDDICTGDVSYKCNNIISDSPSLPFSGCPSMSSITFLKDEDIPYNLRHEILVPAGTSKKVEVRARYFHPTIKHSKLICRFNIEGQITTVDAHYFNAYDEIDCDPMIFDYTKSEPNTTAPVEVVWGGSNVIDNPKNVHVVIYKCRNMASDCNTCQGLDKRFGCGWCQDTSQCEIKNQCNGGSGKWLDKGQTCSNPTISDFSPQLGLWQGGTNVTIQGINLGRIFRDIYSGITVAGIPCEPYEHLYKPSREIVCYLNGTGTTEIRSGPVIVRVGNFSGESKQKFTFVDPQIEDISPMHGPLSGGTELTIRGKYMDAGRLVEVFINELPCKIISRNSAEIKCTTSASSKLLNGNVTVKFDQITRTHKKGVFMYYNDCNVHTSCTACVTSSFPCDWCIDGYRCTNDTAVNCRNDILVTGVNRGGPSYRSGPTFCPAINATQGGSSEILIAANTKKSIRVNIHIIGQFIVQTRFLCQFNIEGRVTSVNADLIGDKIYCEGMEFSYTQRGANMTATFAVIWGGSKPLDNPSNVHVVIYKCNEMAKSSDQCSTLETKYSCGWCLSSNSCEFKDQCKDTL